MRNKTTIILILLLFSSTAKSQSKEEVIQIKSWFKDFVVCKCISYNYWKKNILIDDKSAKFWNENAPISSSNMEIIEDFISSYQKKHDNKNIINSCLLIKEQKEFNVLLDKIISSDLILKEVNYQMPNLND